jgi:glycine/D-amino acid oxidase-like deaminating enzyme
VRAPSGEIVVVGAGVFGTAAALELRARGHGVTVLEPGPIPNDAASSTDVSKMVRMDYGSDVFYHEMAEAALDGWDRWNTEWPRPLYHQTGFLILTAKEMEEGGFELESWRVLRERGYAPTRIGGSTLSEHYPAWRAGRYRDGYVSARGGWAESAAVVSRLAELCVEAGVRIVRTGFASLLEEGSRVGGVRTTDGEELRSGHVVVCAGAWTPTLLPWLADVLQATAQPVLHFHAQDADAYRGAGFIPFAADIASSGWYGFPALADGRVKVVHHGRGTPVDPDAPGRVTDEHVARARRFLAESIPGLADAPLVDRRICMYCDSFDGDLWIDHDPEREGLVVAAGGSGHAFKFAPLLGPLIADVLEGKPSRWAERFRWRGSGEARTEEARFGGA